MPGPPLPDPDAVRLCPIPDSAPPYDDELLHLPPAPPGGSQPPRPAADQPFSLPGPATEAGERTSR